MRLKHIVQLAKRFTYLWTTTRSYRALLSFIPDYFSVQIKYLSYYMNHEIHKIENRINRRARLLKIQNYDTQVIAHSILRRK